MRDLDDVCNSRRGAECFDFRAASTAADSADDGALFAVDHVSLKTTFLDSLDDVVDLVGGCVA